MASRDEIRAAEIKQTRRGILDTLRMVYPAGLTFATICGAFVELDEHYIKSDLTYLIQKGYILWTNEGPNAAWKERKYKLTAAGVEIGDKINIDLALEP